jgi:hypothetical protein
MAIEVLNLVKDIAIIIGMPILRSVTGWAQNALQDNVVSTFEWKQLAETVIRVGTISIVAYLGFNSVGVDISAWAASFGAIAADLLFSALKKVKKAE